MNDERTTCLTFEVVRNELSRTRLTESPVPSPADGEIVVAVDGFGFTANNVSYAVFGDILGYWSFFPSEDGWGQIPSWGFAEVTASGHTDVPVGTRLFGYLPMASHLVLRPGSVTNSGLVDTSVHRAALPAAYNSYRLTAADPRHDPDLEAEQMLLWPLFSTGFVIDRFLAANDDFGAGTHVLSSASSKTAVATAHCLARRGVSRLVGLTSADHLDLVRSLDLYDRVVTYDEVDGLDVDDAVYLDFAGNAKVRAALHRRFGDRLAHSAIIGGTHWDAGDPVDTPGPEPTFFFAPDHWGPDAEVPLAEAWPGFIARAATWLRVEHHTGPDAVRDTYLATLAGEADPSIGAALAL